MGLITGLIKDIAQQIRGEGGFLRVARDPLAVDDYLFIRELYPLVPTNSYKILSQAAITVRPTMAGFVGMDSEYKPTGQVIRESLTGDALPKIAPRMLLPEQTLRELDDLAVRQGSDALAIATNATWNFYRGVIVRSITDRLEHMTITAALNGLLDNTTGYSLLNVSYGYTAGQHTVSYTGNNKFGGSTSQWWTFVRLARKKLGNAQFVMSEAMWEIIEGNTVNNIVVLSESYDDDRKIRTVRIGRASTTTANGLVVDARDQGVVIRTYDAKGYAYAADPTAALTEVPFFPDLKVFAYGRVQKVTSLVDSSAEVTNLGYVHMGPTVEGGSAGIWGRVYVPEDKQYQVIGEGVSNALPVANRASVLVATTDA